MIVTPEQQLTAQFYAWEGYGRGWYLASNPVELEPPFEPFFFQLPPKRIIDDGKRPFILNQIVRFFLKFITPKKKSQIVDEDDELTPFPFNDDSSLCIFRVMLPEGYKVRIAETEQLLLMLSNIASPVSFEIIGTHTAIYIQFVCREQGAAYLQSQIKAYFPGSVIEDVSDTQEEIIQTYKQTVIADFGLEREFMLPLFMPDNFYVDPFTGICAVLENIAPGEQVAIQVLFTGAVNQWSNSIIRSVSDGAGGPFFMDAPEMLTLAREKIKHPLFGVTIRCVGQSSTIERAYNLVATLGQTLIRMSQSENNSLVPLEGEYDLTTRADDIWFRQSHRFGMLLNARELATFVHLPSETVVSKKLQRDARKTKALPPIAEGNQVILGANLHQGVYMTATLNPLQRFKHMHIIGATGTGKSTLLLSLIVQDIANGNGFAVLDPHGDLIENILPYIPLTRADDVVILDPADQAYPVGFNILSAHSEIEKEILASDLVAGFKRLSTSWGDQMNSVLANAILAFLESDQVGTLADLRRFLIEKGFRDAYLQTVHDPNIVYYWTKEYPLLKTSSIGSILTRLDSFLRPKLIRNMVAQKKSLNFEEILDTKKILLVKLSQGLIGAENSYLLGTFVVSKIHQAAIARQAIAKADRSDFFLYIDEFQNFITPSMSSILSGTRKYNMGLILVHQDMQQLQKYDSELVSSVITNAGTRICFRLGDIDAKKFETGFASFEAKDLQNLSTGEAIARIEKPEFDFSLLTVPLPDSPVPVEVKEQIIAKSREKYATPQQIVEQILAEGMHIDYVEIKKSEPIPVERKPEKKEKPAPVVETSPEASPVAVQQPVPIEVKKDSQTQEKKKESKHRYLQTLIKRMAESRGYAVTLEETTPDGKGKVDVGLLRNDRRIACEISVTTTDAWEVHNVEKCLAAGYDVVIVCSTDKKHLEKINKLIKGKLDTTLQTKILTLQPEGLFLYLDQEIANEVSGEERIKGYRVKVNYTAVPQDSATLKREQIIKAIADSLRKKKGK